MARGTHDDEPTRWTSIGWQALLITNRLRNHAQLTEKQHPEDCDHGTANNGNAKQPEKHPDEERRYIEHRLRELAAWERRIGGKKN